MITEETILSVREKVKPYLTSKRYLHTLAVEREAIALGEEFLPEKINELRAAALLHDITKKLTTEEQIAICKRLNIPVTREDILSPKLFHAKTGAKLCEKAFGDVVTEDIISGIRWHTTGRAAMTLFEMIIYLADYIEDTRTFADCVELRAYFYSEMKNAAEESEKAGVLIATMVKSFDMTIRNLIEESRPIDRNTFEARNRFVNLMLERELKGE